MITHQLFSILIHQTPHTTLKKHIQKTEAELQLDDTGVKPHMFSTNLVPLLPLLLLT